MMQECPKCGFVQPKDQYCASCGVDIEHYKPAPTSPLKLLLKSSAFYVIAVVIVIGGLGAWIFATQKEQIEQKLLAIRTGAAPQKNEVVNEASPLDEEDVDPAEAAQLANENTMGEPAASANGIVATQTEPSAAAKLAASGILKGTSPSTSATSSAAASIPAQIHVQFFEMSRMAIEKLTSESQVLSDSNQARVLLISGSDPAAKAKEAGEIDSLPGGDNAAVTLNTPFQMDFTSLTSTGVDAGLNLTFTPMQISGSTVEFDLEGTVALRTENGSSLTTTQVSASFSFSPKNSIAVIGAVPHQGTFIEDQGLFNNTPLAILFSPDFKARMSDFVILVSVK